LTEQEVSKNILRSVLSSFNIDDISDVFDEMKMASSEKIIKSHPYPISPCKDGRWMTYIDDELHPKGKKQVKRSTRESVENAIIEKYCKIEKVKKGLSLAELFQEWMLWRRDIGTNPKTITENHNEWKKYVADYPISNINIRRIDDDILDDYFLKITGNYQITYKRLSNVCTMLRLMFKYAVKKKMIPFNPIDTIDLTDYKKRCKPSKSNKDNYTQEDRELLLKHLEPFEDIYSLAIKFAFYTCLRIGELTALKKEDYQNGQIYIGHSQHRVQELNDDMTFGKAMHFVDDRIKGNTESGFRTIPLVSKAQKIIEQAIELYPDTEYIFHRDGVPLYPDSFNKHLKKHCEAAGVKYRSSHQIRFTNATAFAENNIPITQISTMLGHSNTNMTMHYIRKAKISNQTLNIMENMWA